MFARRLVPALFGIAVCCPVVFAQRTFEFGLDGGQEIPPNDSRATGAAIGVLSADQTTFDLVVTHSVSSPTGAHIHRGAPGTIGNIVFDLGDPTTPIQAQWNPTPQDVADLLAGNLYVNVHSTDFSGGEIRGQIVEDCRTGRINLGAGTVADILFVNGSNGGASRTVPVAQGTLLWAALLLPPAGGNGKYVVHGNLGQPSGLTARVLPADIGTFCFPLLLSTGASPQYVGNNLGKQNLVGASAYFGTAIPDPSKAPAVFLQLTNGDTTHLPAGTLFTLQAVAVDPASVSPKGASTSNAIIIQVE